jgi:general secretion pathway protein E
MATKILSGPGGQFELDPEYRDVLCILESGIILISEHKASDPVVRSKVARATQYFILNGKQPQFYRVEVAKIQEAYSKFGSSSKVEIDTTKMQKDAIKMFEEAVSHNASDIHIRIEEQHADVFFRIDGDLNHIRDLPLEYAKAMVQSIYVSLTDVSDTTFKEKARQDARISDKKLLPKRLHGLRLATSPTVAGLIMVQRLLYNSDNGSDIVSLGYTKDHLSQISLMMSQPYGINLISGPTGSGKSTTLQRVLARLYEQTEGKAHIMTVEDPPEYPILGAVQTPVIAEKESDRAEAFRSAIRSALRLDPDILMIGEIRDLETAQLAINGAMTGHQLWTTVHANNAMAIFDRLVEIGVSLPTICDPSLITGLAAQRLVKKLCKHCRIPYDQAKRDGLVSHSLDQRVSRALNHGTSGVFMRNHKGCKHCRFGVDGRTVLAEIIIPDAKLCDYIRRGERMQAIHHWVREQQGKTMLDHAIMKVSNGEVDPLDAEKEVGPLTMGLAILDHSLQLQEVTDMVGESVLHVPMSDAITKANEALMGIGGDTSLALGAEYPVTVIEAAAGPETAAPVVEAAVEEEVLAVAGDVITAGEIETQVELPALPAEKVVEEAAYSMTEPKDEELDLAAIDPELSKFLQQPVQETAEAGG